MSETYIRRDELRPGDVARSSHYGERVVKEITQHGTAGQTTHIVWEGSKPGHVMSERYDSDTPIERIKAAPPAEVAPLPTIARIVEGMVDKKVAALAHLKDVEKQRVKALAKLAALDEERADALVAARELGYSWETLAETVNTSRQNVTSVATRRNGGVTPLPKGANA